MEIHDKLKQLNNTINTHFFKENREFRGCYSSRKGFLENDFIVDIPEKNETLSVMLAIIKYNEEVGPLPVLNFDYKKYIYKESKLLKNSTTSEISDLNKTKDVIGDDDTLSIVSDSLVILDGIGTLGAGTTSTAVLSQQSQVMESNVKLSSSSTIRSLIRQGDSIYNMTQQVIESIKTEKQKQKFIDFLSTFHADNLAENNPQYSDPAKRKGLLMLYADESGRNSSSKRIKRWTETHRKSEIRERKPEVCTVNENENLSIDDLDIVKVVQKGNEISNAIEIDENETLSIDDLDNVKLVDLVNEPSTAIESSCKDVSIFKNIFLPLDNYDREQIQLFNEIVRDKDTQQHTDFLFKFRGYSVNYLSARTLLYNPPCITEERIDSFDARHIRGEVINFLFGS